MMISKLEQLQKEAEVYLQGIADGIGHTDMKDLDRGEVEEKIISQLMEAMDDVYHMKLIALYKFSILGWPEQLEEV